MDQGTNRDVVMRDLRHASRVIGLCHGTGMFLVTAFIGTITSKVATAVVVDNGLVTGANTAGGFLGSVLALALIVQRRGVPRRWVTVSIFALASAGAVLVATAGLVFKDGGIWFVYVGLGLASLALVALTPIRPAVSARFASDKLDGTFTSRSRAWSYGTTGGLVLIVGAVAASPLGWRIAVLGCAGWIAGCAAMLAGFQRFPDPTPQTGRIESWELWDTLRVGQQRRMVIAVGAAAFTAQLVYVSLEPYLSAPARLGMVAPAYVGVGLGLVKIAIIPVILRQGALSDDRVRRSAMRAGRSLAAAAAIAVAMFFSLPLVGLLIPLLAALVLVELGNGPMADAARTYGSRLSVEADAMSTVSQQFAYDIAGVVATFAQLPFVVTAAARLAHAITLGLVATVSTWDIVLVWWALAALLVLRITSQTDWRVAPRARINADSGPQEFRIAVGLKPGTLAAFRVVVRLRNIDVTAEVTDGARYTVHAVVRGGNRNPEIPSCMVWFGVTRPRRPRRRSGHLFPLAVFPVVAVDPSTTRELNVGRGLWLGRPGTWRLENNTIVCRSSEFRRTVIGNLYLRND